MTSAHDVTGEHAPDPAVVEAVEHVRDRFGAVGLRDMIGLAQRELVTVEEALQALRETVVEEPAGGEPR